MSLSTYDMLKALGYGADTDILETKRILSRFKLFGLILHDPKLHSDFHDTLSKSFERLDYLTGEYFLFFAITDPPIDWIEISVKREYFRFLSSRFDSYSVEDRSITAYTMAQGLGIDFDDLPVIILSHDFKFKEFRVVRTCPKYLEKQMAEIGYFLSRRHKGFNLMSDSGFNMLIKSIDLCGGSYHITHEEFLAKTVYEFLVATFTGRGRRFAINDLYSV
ncbi:MAG: hypothetical protein N2510_08225, partial [Ignavibacteria bacterium]|nr:hypothetical protein [Ignavibacteria bacterium]